MAICRARGLAIHDVFHSLGQHRCDCAPGAIFFITKASVQPVTELLRAAQGGEAGFVEPGNADSVPPAQNVRFR